MVSETYEIGNEATLFALATFSEDRRIHFGFSNHTTKDAIISAAQFPPNYSKGYGKTNDPNEPPSEWIPHNEYGGKDWPDGMSFGYTDYGKIIDVIQEVYSEPKYGARADAEPLVFIVTDGNMDDQSATIYAQNGCPAAGSSDVCGEKCKQCWRDQLAKRMKNVNVHGKTLDDITVIGIGDKRDQNNQPDNRTLMTLARGNPDHVIQHPSYTDLQVKVLPRIQQYIRNKNCEAVTAAIAATTTTDRPSPPAATTADPTTLAESTTTPPTDSTPMATAGSQASGVYDNKADCRAAGHKWIKRKQFCKTN